MRLLSYFKLHKLKNTHFKSFFTDHNLINFETSRKISLAIIIISSFLIFLSIIPLAAQEVWNEAILVAVIFVLSVINIWINRLEIENRQLLTPIFILAGYSFLQGLATILFPVYSAVFPVSFDPTASLWSGFKIFAVALFLGLLLRSSHKQVKFLSWGLVITGNFFAVFGIARFLLQPAFEGLFENMISSRLTTGIGFGTYFNQNHFAYLMLMVFGLNICLFWYGKLSTGVRFFLLTASLLTWTALVLTGSRGGITGSFVEIAVLIFLPVIMRTADKHKNRKKSFQLKLERVGKPLAILGIIFGLLIVGIVLIGQDRVVERFEDIPQQIGGITNAATFRRTDVWQAALLIIKDFPLFGIGFGGFQIAVSQYIEISGQLVPKQAHNDYLELAASGGIVAVALAIWFLFRFFSLVRKRFAESPDPFSGAVRAGAICGIMGAAFHNFFDFGLQIMANLLFFAALLFVAVHKPPKQNKSDTDSFTKTKNIFFNLSFSLLSLSFAFSAAFFGYGRYQIEQTKIAPNIEFAEDKLYKIPFDADYYETKAIAYENYGNFEAAAYELKKAVAYRPKDYNLWIKSGQFEELQNHKTEAETAFRRAIELAPNYGKPYLYYGNFLVKTDRKNEGFIELRTASRRNPQYFEEVVALFMTEKAGNAGEAFKLLEPLEVNEKEKLASFLFEKGEFGAVTQLACRKTDLSEPTRERLFRQLLEKQRYYFADRIYRQNCTSEEIKSEIEDGGFDDTNIREATGFGWRIDPSSSNTIVSFDEGSMAKGQSLRFNFNGQENSFALLSQLVIVEKNRQYKLNFSYKTGDIITGGAPILQIILKKPDSETSDGIGGETKLSLKENAWVQSSIEFETDNRTEAVEIRLTRQSCAENLCPIFGNLWLDDFYLQKKN